MIDICAPVASLKKDGVGCWHHVIAGHRECDKAFGEPDCFPRMQEVITPRGSTVASWALGFVYRDHVLQNSRESFSIKTKNYAALTSLGVDIQRRAQCQCDL